MTACPDPWSSQSKKTRYKQGTFSPEVERPKKISSRPEWSAMTRSLEKMLVAFGSWASAHGIAEKSKVPHLIGSTLGERLNHGMMLRREDWLWSLGALEQDNHACTIGVDWEFSREGETFKLRLAIWGDVLRDGVPCVMTDSPSTVLLTESDEGTVTRSTRSPARFSTDMGNGRVNQELNDQRLDIVGTRRLSWWTLITPPPS